METEPSKTSQPYQTPQLEQHTAWTGTTGVSLPIGTTGVDSPFEMNDFMEGEQQ